MVPHLTPIVEGNDVPARQSSSSKGGLDDASLWDGAVTALRETYRCVRMTLPNYGGDRTARWGYSYSNEIVEALERLVREAGGGKTRATLVLHDWGCFWGHALHHRNPDLVARVAGVDVAPHYAPTFFAMSGIVAYQGWLLGAFAAGGPIGDAMTRGFAKLARVQADETRLNAWMNYPYRNFWADIFTGRAGKLLEGYWPKCPLLFVYGEKKPFPFHSAAWVDPRAEGGGEVVGLPCDHWVPHRPEFVDIAAPPDG